MEGDIGRTMSVAEAAEILGIGRNAAYEAVKTGQIPAIKIGKRILVPRAALDRLLEKGVPAQGDASYLRSE